MVFYRHHFRLSCTVVGSLTVRHSPFKLLVQIRSRATGGLLPAPITKELQDFLHSGEKFTALHVQRRSTSVASLSVPILIAAFGPVQEQLLEDGGPPRPRHVHLLL